jgi:hypothetical protein
MYASILNTRGHRHKLFVTRCYKLVFSTFFLNRITPIWNRLPDYCFDCYILHIFKRKISYLNLNHRAYSKVFVFKSYMTDVSGASLQSIVFIGTIYSCWYCMYCVL